jgi:hypothetical protein
VTRSSRAKAPVAPKTLTSSGAKRGLFTRHDFIYDAEHDHYACPADARLTKIHRRVDHDAATRVDARDRAKEPALHHP